MSNTPAPEESQELSHRRIDRLGRYLLGAVITALLIRFTIRDSIDLLSVYFYMTPLVVLMIVSGLGISLATLRKKSLSKVIWIGLLLITTALWRDTQCKSFPVKQSAVDENEISLLFANLARQGEYTSISDLVREQQPDIVGFVESFGDPDQRRQYWLSKFPDYKLSILGAGIEVLTKGESGEAVVRSLGPSSELRHLTIKIDDKSVECIVVDIDGTIYRSRRTPLKLLSDYVEKLSSDHVLILGDFNTPVESVHFESLRRRFRNLYEIAGQGHIATWPRFLPVLSLDQVWLGPGFSAASCEHASHTQSDHLAVLGQVEFLECGSGANGESCETSSCGVE